MKHTSLLLIALVLAPLAGLTAQPNLPPGRPADFRPFHYECSTEQLAEELSAAQMKRAESELKAIEQVNERGSWKPTWESLDRHQAPEWFLDAKLGVMLTKAL